MEALKGLLLFDLDKSFYGSLVVSPHWYLPRVASQIYLQRFCVLMDRYVTH